MLNNNDVRIKDYIEQLTGEPMQLDRLDMSSLRGLALHVRKSYQLYHGHLLGHELVFACQLGNGIISPIQAQKHITAISTQVDKPVVLVLGSLANYLRTRYVEQRIPFLVPNQQLYLPALLIDLRTQKTLKKKERTSFRPATQCMLLYHLLINHIDGMRQDQIAECLGYSTMTISRAIQECQDRELIKRGRGPIRFKQNRMASWQAGKAYLQSPVKRRAFTNDHKSISNFLGSGITALGHYTDLADENRMTVGMSLANFKTLVKHYPQKINDYHGEHTIEVWTYEPQLLTNTSFVDPLSLHLSLVNDELDERTSKAIDQLINYIHD